MCRPPNIRYHEALSQLVDSRRLAVFGPYLPEFSLCASCSSTPLRVPFVESEQQALQIRFLIGDLEVRPGGQGGRVTTGCPILVDPIAVQEHERMLELPPGWVSFQTAASFLDD